MWKPHFHPNEDKFGLVEDINEWMTKVSGDPTLQLKNPERISKGDLQRLVLAIRDSIKEREAVGSQGK